MKRPSFQFYPADWSANSNLRRCTHEEKGIWIDVMCLLHDQEEYGIARWPLKEIAQAIGCTVQKLRGLVTKGVIKGADAGQKNESLVYVPRSGRKEGPAVTLINPQEGPIWFSSRMVIDEYKRVLRGEYGTTPKPTPDPSPKGAIGATPKPTPDPSPSRAHASSSSSSSPSVNQESTQSSSYTPESDDFLPASPGDWLRFFENEHGISIDPTSIHDRKKFWPLATGWVNSKVCIGQMRTAIAKAKTEAKEAIAYLPGYADRVMANIAPIDVATTKRKPAPENFETRDYGKGGKI